LPTYIEPKFHKIEKIKNMICSKKTCQPHDDVNTSIEFNNILWENENENNR